MILIIQEFIAVKIFLQFS